MIAWNNKYLDGLRNILYKFGKTFILVTLHVLFGDHSVESLPELRAIAAWLRGGAREMNSFNQNLITLGDFNIDLLGSDLADALFSTGVPWRSPEPAIGLSRRRARAWAATRWPATGI